MVDIFKEAYDSVKERMKNPFTEKNTTPFAGAYIIALLIYNWKIVFSLFNFDDTDIRENKIDVISSYLQQECWTYRIGNPLLIAFGSILFYYVFNNFSLVITTAFNSWVKPFVLKVVGGKAKIVTREDFDKAMNNLELTTSKFETLKKASAESQAEIDRLNKETSKLNVETTGINNQLLAVQTDLQSKNQELAEIKSFKILYAHYGTNAMYKDVTALVQRNFNDMGQFDVKNVNLGGDPMIGAEKELLIVYGNRENVKTIVAEEESKVELNGENILVTFTDENYRRTEEKLLSIFSGVWRLSYAKEGDAIQSETFRINNRNQYFINNQLTFVLRNIKVHSNQISFDKIIPVNNIKHSTETLYVESPIVVRGKDSIGNALEYGKVS